MHAPLPRPQLLFVVSVVERQHRRRMPHLDESLAGPAPDSLCRRIRSNQRGMFSLKLLQLLHQLVERSIADLGIVESVIKMLVIANLFAERSNLLFDVFRSRSHRRRL